MTDNAPIRKRIGRFSQLYCLGMSGRCRNVSNPGRVMLINAADRRSIGMVASVYAIL